jgi:ribosomal protein L37E
MSWTRCRHCGNQNFTVAGWADLDSCSCCGRPLGRSAASEVSDYATRRSETEAVLEQRSTGLSSSTGGRSSDCRGGD